jgi:N-methylhydantoinase A
MSILGLHLGVSFAELSLLDPGSQEIIAHQRVFLPRLPLKNALQKFQQKTGKPVEKVFLASNHIEKLAPFRLGGSTAHLVTEGWENTGWLSQHLPNSNARPPAVQSQDLIFAVKERVSSSGQILISLDTEFVTQIAAKLKLMEVKRVCLHFLNSQKNTAHLKQASDILKTHGFEVYDFQFDSDRDLEKSRRLSLTAAVAGTWDDIKLELTQAFTETPAIHVLNSRGFKELSQATDALENLAGLDYLWAHFKNQNIVHLGLESFFQVFPNQQNNTWESPWGPVYRPHPRKRNLGTQPGSPVQLNFWNELDFEGSAESFEPGPISFGRGQKLTAFDMFFEEMLQQPELTDWLSPTSANKINSNLTALSKSSKENKGAADIAKSLREEFKNRVMLEVENQGEPVFVGFWTKLLDIGKNEKKRPLSEFIARAGMDLPL